MKKKLEELKKTTERLINDFYISEDEGHKSLVILNIMTIVPTLEMILDELPDNLQKKEIQKDISKLKLIAIY